MNTQSDYFSFNEDEISQAEEIGSEYLYSNEHDEEIGDGKENEPPQVGNTTLFLYIYI
jgi:hypothetical protein